MSHEVYVVEYTGMPRNHHAIFARTHESGSESGHIFQVKGDIQNGMTFEDKPAKNPEDSASYLGKTLIGNIATENYSRIREICEDIPPPRKQFQGPRRLYPNEPLRRCQEWTSEAVQALRDAKVVQ